jgi:hypothetical protein
MRMRVQVAAGSVGGRDGVDLVEGPLLVEGAPAVEPEDAPAGGRGGEVELVENGELELSVAVQVVGGHVEGAGAEVGANGALPPIRRGVPLDQPPPRAGDQDVGLAVALQVRDGDLVGTGAITLDEGFAEHVLCGPM